MHYQETKSEDIEMKVVDDRNQSTTQQTVDKTPVKPKDTCVQDIDSTEKAKKSKRQIYEEWYVIYYFM